MHFVDECTLTVQAGDGGNGAVAFRREKYVPMGGPAGGDGGRGGSVVFVGDEGLGTLHDLTHQRTIVAPRGADGANKDMYGRSGEDVEVRVPLGTVISEDGTVLFEFSAHRQREVVARGGRGGRGNRHFATPVDRGPRHAEPGEAGERRKLKLELKVMADVGLLGFPNVGKSTFVAAVSAARPKIADYPFTTLSPSVGVVNVAGGPRAGGAAFVIADIPGLIPGAAAGAGLGNRFLKHVERTRALLHLVTIEHGEGREPLADYKAIRAELAAWSPELAERPEIVALSKADLPDVRDAYPALKRRFARHKIKLRLVSAATREGLDELIVDLFRLTKVEA
jgi:GTP-binding protein